MCDKIPDAHDGRMLDSAFLAYVLERYIREDLAYKIKCLRHLVLAYLKHDVSHYKVFFNLYSFFNFNFHNIKYSWVLGKKYHDYTSQKTDVSTLY